MKGQSHSDETRAAVMAALLTGQGVSETARALNLPKATVSRIKSEISRERLEQVGTEREERLIDLVMDYVSTNLRTLKAQSIEVGRADYVKKQSASEIAVLHGVLADKTVRILAALEPDETAEPELTSQRVN